MTGLVLKDIRKTYGQVKVLQGIDLTIEEGEFVRSIPCRIFTCP